MSLISQCIFDLSASNQSVEFLFLNGYNKWHVCPGSHMRVDECGRWVGRLGG